MSTLMVNPVQMVYLFGTTAIIVIIQGSIIFFLGLKYVRNSLKRASLYGATLLMTALAVYIVLYIPVVLLLQR